MARMMLDDMAQKIETNEIGITPTEIPIKMCHTILTRELFLMKF
jgi:hypothetical protein